MPRRAVTRREVWKKVFSSCGLPTIVLAKLVVVEERCRDKPEGSGRCAMEVKPESGDTPFGQVDRLLSKRKRELVVHTEMGTTPPRRFPTFFQVAFFILVLIRSAGYLDQQNSNALGIRFDGERDSHGRWPLHCIPADLFAPVGSFRRTLFQQVAIVLFRRYKRALWEEDAGEIPIRWSRADNLVNGFRPNKVASESVQNAAVAFLSLSPSSKESYRGEAYNYWSEEYATGIEWRKQSVCPTAFNSNRPCIYELEKPHFLGWVEPGRT